MPILNFEFKARTGRLAVLEERLLTLNPRFAGEDHQLDTYFNIEKGRLKLREGNIENALIWYLRPDTAGAKLSEVMLYKFKPAPELKQILTMVHGIKTVVEKRRKIYFIDHVKFHFDTLEGLGTFVEVEAIREVEQEVMGNKNKKKSITAELEAQCSSYADFLEISRADYVSVSYSDMLLTR
jgi:adenylate cyclase, class 2